MQSTNPFNNTEYGNYDLGISIHQNAEKKISGLANKNN